MMEIVNGHCHRQLHWVCIVYRQRMRWVLAPHPATITARQNMRKLFPFSLQKVVFCIDSERRFQCIHNFVEVIYIEMRWKLIFQRFFLSLLLEMEIDWASSLPSSLSLRPSYTYKCISGSTSIPFPFGTFFARFWEKERKNPYKLLSIKWINQCHRSCTERNFNWRSEKKRTNEKWNLTTLIARLLLILCVCTYLMEQCVDKTQVSSEKRESANISEIVIIQLHDMARDLLGNAVGIPAVGAYSMPLTHTFQPFSLCLSLSQPKPTHVHPIPWLLSNDFEYIKCMYNISFAFSFVASFMLMFSLERQRHRLNDADEADKDEESTSNINQNYVTCNANKC